MHKPCTNVSSYIFERRYSSRFYTIVGGVEMKNDDFSINLSSIFIKLMGIWMANGQSEKCVRNMTILYSIIALLFGLWLQITDMYYSWGDFSVSQSLFLLKLNSQIFRKHRFASYCYQIIFVIINCFFVMNCASIRSVINKKSLIQHDILY